MIKLCELNTLNSFINSSKNLSEDIVTICHDSRAYEGQNTFLAISGENYNALKFLQPMIDQGLENIIYSKNDENDEIVKSYSSVNFIAVDCSIKFVQEYSSFRTKKWYSNSNNKLLAICGSNGKTTTKEMLYSILNEIIPNKVICTQKNNNNHLGVPFTLLDIDADTEVALVEFGSNHPGEIQTLCEICKPNYAVTTNIGETHLEFFKNLDAVFKEEAYPFEFMKSSTHSEYKFFKNSDDEFIKTLESSFVSSFGYNGTQYKFLKKESDYYLNNIKIENENIFGEHNFYNLCLACSIIMDFYPSKTEEIILAAKNFKPTVNRSEIKMFQGSEIYLDAYNANPSSMKAAINSFIDHLDQKQVDSNKRIFVIGDMNELGDYTESAHRELGELLSSIPHKDVFYVGQYASFFRQGFGDEATFYENVAEFKESFQKLTSSDKFYCLIKGSRSLQLEQILDIN